MKSTTRLAALRSALRAAVTAMVVLASSRSPVRAVPEQPPDFGLRGLRRVQLVFLAPRAEEDPFKRAECRPIAELLVGKGLEVVDGCRRYDAACGKLFFTVESNPIIGGEGSAYVAEIALSQQVQLVREPARELTAPITWSERRFGTVDAHHSLSEESCLRLQDLVIRFTVSWQLASR
ncbi:MAG: hypothetical protein LAO51_06420 [Acidobacteriia bacterium]|nr:hypothetical protein [Terriglobia bacterium]